MAQTTPTLRDLYQSIMEGDTAKVRAQCAGITDLSRPLTPHGDNILHTAICMGREGIASEILKKYCKEPERLVLRNKNVLGDTVLHEAAATGMTSLVQELLKSAPELQGMGNKRGETPIFKAAHYGKADTFRALADKLDEKEKEPENKMAYLKRNDGTTILHITILAEFFDLALDIANRYPDLIDAKGPNQTIGLQFLSSNPSGFKSTSGSNYGFFKKFIYYCVPSEDTKKEEDSNPRDTHESELPPNYDVCVQCFSMVVRILISGWLVMESIHKEKRKHESALKLAKLLIARYFSWELSKSIEFEDRISLGKEEARSEEQGKAKIQKYRKNTRIPDGGQPWPEYLPNVPPVDQGTSSSNSLKPTLPPPDISLHIATRTGIVEIVKEILRVSPQAVEHVNDKGENILHVAIKHRQLEIFRIVKRMDIPMARLVRQFDQRGYTILHHVGVMRYYTGGTQPGPALQLQEELRWFKRVKKVTLSHYEMHRSKEFDETAQEFFEHSHEKLLNEAQEWLKRTSESCSAVAVLIATVAFAAAYTVPGGSNQETGVPILLHDPFFLVFTVMDVLSLASSLTSVVMFLSILTSPFQLQDFRQSLPRKLTLGFTFLFFSVAVTMLAFSATIVLIIHLKKRLTTTLIYTAAFLPVTIFALLQFPLYLASMSTLKFTLKLIRNFLPRCVLPSRFQKTTTPYFYKTH